MNKDAQFDAWLKLKKNLHNSTTILSYQEGQVCWAAIGCNIGFEQDGKSGMFSRPVAIVRGFSRNIIWIVPLSTTGKKRYLLPTRKAEGYAPRRSFAVAAEGHGYGTTTNGDRDHEEGRPGGNKEKTTRPTVINLYALAEDEGGPEGSLMLL